MQGNKTKMENKDKKLDIKEYQIEIYNPKTKYLRIYSDIYFWVHILWQVYKIITLIQYAVN